MERTIWNCSYIAAINFYIICIVVFCRVFSPSKLQILKMLVDWSLLLNLNNRRPAACPHYFIIIICMRLKKSWKKNFAWKWNGSVNYYCYNVVLVGSVIGSSYNCNCILKLTHRHFLICNIILWKWVISYNIKYNNYLHYMWSWFWVPRFNSVSIKIRFFSYFFHNFFEVSQHHFVSLFKNSFSISSKNIEKNPVSLIRLLYSTLPKNSKT